MFNWLKQLFNKPQKPRCTAMLKSGERCIFEPNHSGPHIVHVNLSGDIFGPYQTYCWKDPNNGLYPVGFWYR